MSGENILDIAHMSFLELIQAMVQQSGVANTKGTLMRVAVKAEEKIDPVDYPTFDDFLAACADVSTPLATIEGAAVHYGDGLFGLPNCPFAPSIANYKRVFKTLPEEFDEVTEEYNRPGPATAKYRVGEGAGVSPFCAVHQPLRSAVGNRVTIGGKAIAIHQLGCKSGSGDLGVASSRIEGAGFTKEKVEEVLAENMCCYWIEVTS